VKLAVSLKFLAAIGAEQHGRKTLKEGTHKAGDTLAGRNDDTKSPLLLEACPAKKRVRIAMKELSGFGAAKKLRLPNPRIIVHDCRFAETMTCPPPKNPWK